MRWRFILCLLMTLAMWTAGAGKAQAQVPDFDIQNGNWWRNCASLDLDFYNDRYYINQNTSCDGTVGTHYSGATYGTNVTNFITGTGATFTRAGSNVTSTASPFYLSSIQSFVSRATVTNNVTSTTAPFYTSASQSWVSRASTASYFDSTGTLQTAASGVARNASYTYSGGSWVAQAANALPPQTISSITDSSGTATVTTGVAHGLVVGNSVTLSGNYPSNYNGTYTIVSVPSSTTFTYTMSTDPGVNASQIGSYTTTATTPAVLIEPSTTNSIRNNTLVGAVVADGIELSNNGAFSTTSPNVCSGSATSSASGLSCSNGTSIAAQTISSITYSGTTATLTTGAAHGLAVGNIVTISGVTGTSAAKFNGTFMVTTVPSTTTFKYTMVAAPTSAATVTGASYTATTGGWAGTVNGGTGTATAASGSMTLTGDGTNSAAIYQAITTVIGNVYVFSVTTGSNPVTVLAGTTLGGANLQGATTAIASATSLYEFKATSTTTYITIKNIITTAATVSAVSFQSAGVFPTNWTWSQNDSGIALYVHALGTQNGMSYIDFQILGTPQNGYPSTVAADSSTAAIVGQPWTTSVYVMKVSGTSTEGIYMCYYATVNPGCPAGTTVGTHTNITSSRISSTITPANATLTSIYDYISWQASVGVATNAVFRVGMPQREQSSVVTSPIATSGSTVTRAADVYNQQPASYVDNTGTLQFATANTARDNHNATSPYTDLGTLIEPATTNSIRNNMMVGAVAADGIERTNNGTFTSCSGSTCSGWTTNLNSGTGSVSYASGTATLTGDGTNAASIYQAVPTIAGYLYTIAVTTVAGNAVTVQAGTAAGGATLLAASTVAASTTTSYQFTATGTLTYIQINNASATAANVDTVSVQSAGHMPTDWNVNANNTGVVASIVGTGAEEGINYIDVKFVGTTIASTNNLVVTFEGNTVISASQNQTWTELGYFKLTSGAWGTYVQGPQWKIQESSSGGTDLVQNAKPFSPLPTGSNLSIQPYTYTYTTTNASIAYIQPFFLVQYSSGIAVNFTLRIGMPQMEQNSYGTSVIPTFGTAVTRTADVYNQPVGTYFNGSGVLTTAASNVPRMDHSPTSNYAPQGILIEESRANIDPYSNDTTQASEYIPIAVTPANSAGTSPDGTNDANTVMETTASTGHYLALSPTGLTANTAYAASVMVKPNGRSNVVLSVSGVLNSTGSSMGINCNLATGTTGTVIGSPTTYGMTPMANGWYRCWLTFTTASSVSSGNISLGLTTGDSGSGGPSYTGIVTDGVYTYGFQVEAGSFLTSYIPTNGTSLTRNPDAFTIPVTAGGGSGWYSQGVGTMGAVANYAVAPVSTGVVPRLSSIDDGTTSNAISFITGASSGRMAFGITTAGATTYNGYVSIADLGIIKSTAGFSSSTVNASFNGTLSGSASPSLPTALTEMNVGGAYGGARNLDGWLTRLWYMPVRDPDASLQQF